MRNSLELVTFTIQLVQIFLNQDSRDYISVKRNLSVISSDPKCKDDNAGFTMEPFKALFDQA